MYFPPAILVTLHKVVSKPKMGVERVRGGGELFKYTMTYFSHLQQYPWGWHWKNTKPFRYLIYCSLPMIPYFAWLHKVTNSPSNVKEWEKIRAARKHTFFDLPHDNNDH